MGLDYKKAGVNIELGDDASKVLYEAAKHTWNNRKGKIGEIIVPFDDFSGLRMIKVGNLAKDSYMCLGFDGVGTKMEVAERIRKHDTIAYDLLAMVCDDAVVRGGEPVVVGSILDVNSLGKDEESYIDFVKQLAVGYVGAAKDAGVAIINGELAELGARVSGYGDFNYNWGASLIWFAKKDRLFTGDEVEEGDSIVALQEKGFRSNGLSLVRKILESKKGLDWHKDEKLAEKVLEPSKIYSKAVCKLTGGFSEKPKAHVSSVSHITGGGVPGKLGRVLKRKKLGAELNNLFSPSDIMLELQKMGDVVDEEAYKTWNMGQGMLITTKEPEIVIETMKKHNINAQIAGKVTNNGRICITSKGVKKNNQILEFEVE